MTALHVVVLICFVYLLFTTAVYVMLTVIGAVESLVRRQESSSEDYETLAASRFTIPVSVLVPAYNEERVIAATTRSMLELDYPEHEVIVVNDGSSDGTLAALVEAFDLEPYQAFVRRVFPHNEARALYRCAEYPNLVVVDKVNGGKADALNAALNVARYRYVCCVDADTWFDREALLKGMRLAVQDPARVIGVTSHLTTARKPEQAMAMPHGRRRVDLHPLMAYQHLDFLRAFFNNRTAWSRGNYMLCSPGAFAIWRRDVLEEVEGYSCQFTCEDIELTFRVHEKYLREGRDYAILCLTDNVATTEGPDTVRKLVSQRERWQRVIDETVWHYRRMWFNPRYKAVGLVGAPFYLLTEVLAPAFEVLGLAALVGAAALGLFQPVTFLVMIAAIAFTNAALTASAILFEDIQSRSYRRRDLLVLLLLTPFDFVVYRPIVFWARLKGSWRFLRGDKSWNKFERNVRAPA
ncbi:MAG TPA: glycosyltransferase [Gaiellaceae bacterium]|nr:glycosyltransferase [Gaiellaceae bacterium]